MKKKKVLLAFDDPGGGLAVSSLIDRLSAADKLELIIYSGKLSQRFLSERGIEFKELESFIKKEEAEHIIEKEAPDILITGTSGGNSEQELRNTAFRLNIKSLVVMDFWKDYTRRWKYSDHTFAEMRDKIFVMDEFMKEEMISENFKSENLYVTGHPYLDMIFNERKEVSADKKKKIENREILFLSQPLEIIGVKDYEIHPLEILFQAIVEIGEKTGKKFHVTIKLHPSEEKTIEITELAEKYNSKQSNIKFAEEEETLEHLIDKSDMVIGYNTIAMFESRSFGKRTISLKVAPVQESLTRAMREAGIEITELNKSSISNFISGNNSINKIEPQILYKGIENSMNVIMKELELK